MLAIARRALPVALASTAVLGVATLEYACGGGDEELTTEPLGPADAEESIADAQKRIAEALSSGDCDQVNEHNPTSRPGQSTSQRCEYLRRIARLESTGAEEYGDAGAVIDYGDLLIAAGYERDNDW